MKNFIVNIQDKNTKEDITSYTVEEETSTVARLLAVGKFRREFPTYSKTQVVGIAKESERKIIKIQEPKLWEYEIT